MLRLFRNYLCLVTALQLGTSVQAQPHSATAPKASKSDVQTGAGDAKSVKTDVKSVVSTKSASRDAKFSKLNVQTGTTVAKSSTVDTKSGTAAATSAIVDPKSGAGVAKSGIADTKSSSAKSIGADAKANKAALSGKSVDATKVDKAAKNSDAKNGKNQEKAALVRHSSTPRPGLVPPPPPDTPTMFAGDGIFAPNFGMTDYTNPAILAGRRKDLVSQLASAKKVLADKDLRTKELKDKATQFQQLFSEGVISRRELESAQRDSDSSVTELNDARTQVAALQNAVSRMDDRMKPRSLAISAKKRGSLKTATRASGKISGASKESNSSSKTATSSSDKQSVSSASSSAQTKSTTVSPAVTKPNQTTGSADKALKTPDQQSTGQTSAREL